MRRLLLGLLILMLAWVIGLTFPLRPRSEEMEYQEICQEHPEWCAPNE